MIVYTPSQLTSHYSGGGRELDAATGRMLRTKDQDQDCRKYKWVMDAFERKLPISVVIGKTLREGA